jgi:hypothetical protein
MKSRKSRIQKYYEELEASGVNIQEWLQEQYDRAAKQERNLEPVKMTFRKFIEGFDGAHNLYIISRGETTLYVGISTVGVWNRWFASRGSHMVYVGPRDNLRLAGFSSIGKEMAENMPASLEWNVELRYYGLENNTDLKSMEYQLIRELKPKFNYIYASNE